MSMKRGFPVGQIVLGGMIAWVFGCSTTAPQRQTKEDDMEAIQSSVRELIEDRSRWVDPVVEAF
jgi:hypothetical protein